MTEQQAQDIYNEFKRLYPNSKDVFSTRVNSIAAWEWSIKAHKRRSVPESVPTFISDIDLDTIKSRSVNNWSQLPEKTKEVYLMVSDCFAGSQVFATGSRIDGTFVDEFSTKEIRAFRQRIGKSEKLISDYDFTFEKAPFYLADALPKVKNKLLMYYSAKIDLLRLDIGAKKIKVPMWDFNRLTDEQRIQARQLFEAKSWGKLMLLHNTAKLSPNNYCCDETPIIKWFTWAYENGKI